jgi:hypothetical protein
MTRAKADSLLSASQRPPPPLKANGGEPNLTTAELHLVELAVRDRLLLDSIDAALAERPLVNRKRGTVAPAVEARFRMADSATRRLQALGLKRVKRRKTVQEIMTEIANEARTE